MHGSIVFLNCITNGGLSNTYITWFSMYTMLIYPGRMSFTCSGKSRLTRLSHSSKATMVIVLPDKFADRPTPLCNYPLTGLEKNSFIIPSVSLFVRSNFPIKTLPGVRYGVFRGLLSAPFFPKRSAVLDGKYCLSHSKRDDVFWQIYNSLVVIAVVPACKSFDSWIYTD